MAEDASAGSERSTIVVADALAAQQWEMHLAAAAIGGSAGAWETPPVKSYAAWLDELWLEHADERGPALTVNQSFALWRRVVAESAESDELIGHAGAAEWAAGAWGLLLRWQIDPATQRAAAQQDDYRALLGWCRAYRSRLDAHGWIDRHEIEAQLTHRGVARGRLVVADLPEPYPARTALLARLASSGLTIEERAAPAVPGTRRAAKLADAADELRAALTWARRHAASDPNARVAVVIPTAARRQDEIARLAAQGNGAAAQPHWSAGRALGTEPVIGAAFDALALLDAHSAYATFGRWLRSPFFGLPPEEQYARARLDGELRAELRSQLPFQAAYRAGLRELLAVRAPVAARALAAALDVIASVRRATPSRWAHLWSRCLVELGWQPPPRAALLGWQSTLDELAGLTPILGDVSFEHALTELARLLERTTPAALPLRGVHVLERIDAVGPGYDAVWVTGFTDSAWPEAPRTNPLLPLALQRAHGMPYSSPADAHERSARALERLLQRSRELVVSWPARVYDYDTEPSPAIRSWPTLATAELDALTAVRRPAAPPRESVDDEAGRFTGARVPGGTGALGRQARCPVRAFCQDRLGARALEPLAFGVTARLRGIATHNAAERLLEDLPAQAALAAKSAAVPHSIERALTRVFGRTRHHLTALYDLEAEQLQRVLAALLHEEQLRAPFRVLAVEQRATIALGSLTLNVRVDRIDVLADGTLAIIDYKTGERATSAHWFGERLRDAQVPLYASHAAVDVGAAVVARLVPTDTRYSGFWPTGAFPGRPSNAALQRDAQLELWRAQLEVLAAEFAAGDTRIFVDDYDDAAADYAPLTRVFEQLAVARGAVARW
ncbi:MAG TPA: PD-(D/E)XK nuclease family protein [Gammaproteobacteria bacterium]|nr:PD-(D/E)XK nuclease family protein [Gammaproteobacteria bacterium]